MPVQIKMPSISYVVARSEPGHVIGCDNNLPWKLKSDLKNFKAITSGHVVIMGRKTFDSIGRPLPNRVNIVISSREQTNVGGIILASGRESALFIADYFSILGDLKDIFVIGGGSIYDEFREQFNKVYLTEVYAEDLKGDAFFKYKFDKRKWRQVQKTDYTKSEVDEYPFSIVVYERRDKKNRYCPLSNFLKRDEILSAWEAEQVDKVTRSQLPDLLASARQGTLPY